MEETIKIRMSAEDKAAFEVAAQVAGLSLSAWCRMKLKEAEASDLRANLNARYRKPLSAEVRTAVIYGKRAPKKVMRE